MQRAFSVAGAKRSDDTFGIERQSMASVAAETGWHQHRAHAHGRRAVDNFGDEASRIACARDTAPRTRRWLQERFARARTGKLGSRLARRVASGWHHMW